MWILPDNQIVSVPKGVNINSLQYPQSIFYGWTKDELAQIGIKRYHPAFPELGYRVTSSVTEEIDGEVYERITTEKE